MKTVFTKITRATKAKKLTPAQLRKKNRSVQRFIQNDERAAIRSEMKFFKE